MDTKPEVARRIGSEPTDNLLGIMQMGGMQSGAASSGAAGSQNGARCGRRGLQRQRGEAAAPLPGGSQDNVVLASNRRPWHMRTTAYLTCESSENLPAHRVYVERLVPQRLRYPTPVLLIQGRYHPSHVWLTKPDGRQGWASAFLFMGYEVVLLDLPPQGRSACHAALGEAHRPDTDYVERELTASAKRDPSAWPSASLHDKWPGTGLHGDFAFDNYYACLDASSGGTEQQQQQQQQQRLCQSAVACVLRWLAVPATLLVGEGSGATVAWLAADIVPELVAAVIAVEPDGPPFGCANTERPDGSRSYTGQIVCVPGRRRFGIADVPLSFEPPLPGEASDKDRVGSDNRPAELQPQAPPFRLVQMHGSTGRGASYLQDEQPQTTASTGGPFPSQDQVPVRKLVRLAQLPHAVVTAEASSHATYDWATVDFLRQAGVGVQWLELAKQGIRGNGHLCFLETNSNVIARFLSLWIQRYVPCARPLEPELGDGGRALCGGRWLPSNGAGSAGLGGAGVASSSTSATAAGDPRAAAQAGQALSESSAPSLRDVNAKYHASISHRMASQGRGSPAAACEAQAPRPAPLPPFQPQPPLGFYNYSCSPQVLSLQGFGPTTGGLVPGEAVGYPVFHPALDVGRAALTMPLDGGGGGYSYPDLAAAPAPLPASMFGVPPGYPYGGHAYVGSMAAAAAPWFAPNVPGLLGMPGAEWSSAHSSERPFPQGHAVGQAQVQAQVQAQGRAQLASAPATTTDKPWALSVVDGSNSWGGCQPTDDPSFAPTERATPLSPTGRLLRCGGKRPTAPESSSGGGQRAGRQAKRPRADGASADTGTGSAPAAGAAAVPATGENSPFAALPAGEGGEGGEGGQETAADVPMRCDASG